MKHVGQTFKQHTFEDRPKIKMPEIMHIKESQHNGI
jgi:hypothetical protein